MFNSGESRRWTGGGNTATGYQALVVNTTGNFNTAIGWGALSSNTTGGGNIAVGLDAGDNVGSGNNNIDVGNSGVGGESNTICIGTQGTQTATFIAGIRGTPVTGGIPVGVTSGGQLGVAPSSQRFKQNIQPMDKASEVIFSLQPVAFRYKRALDPEALPQFGLVAEQVEKVNPDLVARDADGKPFTVRYDEVNVMLLNEFLKQHDEFLKEHKTVQEQGATMAELKKEIAALTATVKKQASQIEKVSAQVEP